MNLEDVMFNKEVQILYEFTKTWIMKMFVS